MNSRQGDILQPGDFPGLEPEPLAILNLADEDATRRLGHHLGRVLTAGQFLGLLGELGAGKTTLVQGLLSGRDGGGQWRATSPTYSLVQIYEVEPPIFHMDLYRLEGWGDLESIGYWDLVESGEGLACVEWLNRIPGAWPGQGLILALSREGNGRLASLWGDATMASTVANVVAAIEIDDE